MYELIKHLRHMRKRFAVELNRPFKLRGLNNHALFILCDIHMILKLKLYHNNTNANNTKRNVVFQNII